MASIRGTDTAPEIAVRRIAHGLGFRYRLHDRRLPGKPDLVFPRLAVVIFVHGCFWHAHSCSWGRKPKANSEFWTRKRAVNRKRDRRVARELRSMGWRVLTIWGCEIRNIDDLQHRLIDFFKGRETNVRLDPSRPLSPNDLLQLKRKRSIGL
jgi:DNA mismatch endonuclease (patch repair protein)